jgi:hypothetical protein
MLFELPGRLQMRQQGTAFILGIVLLAGAGCAKKEEPRFEVKSQAKSTNADGGKTTTTTESLQVGSTLAGTTETTSNTANGKAKSETETVIGTVTAYKPNKEIEVLTGDNKKHDFALDQKDSRVEVDTRITVGTKVQLVQEKDSAGRKMIRVVIEPNR